MSSPLPSASSSSVQPAGGALEALERDAARLWATLKDGGVALAPTATGYGLVTRSAAGVRRLYALKGRPTSKPCVTVATAAIFDDVTAGVSASDRAWLAAAVARWPVAVVARRNLSSSLLGSLDPHVLAQCTQDDTIATFFGLGDVLVRTAALALAAGCLIVGSSANLAGTGNHFTVDDVPLAIRGAVDLIIDGGRCPFVTERRLGSTIIDLTTRRFLREGACFDEISSSWRARDVAPARAV